MNIIIDIVNNIDIRLYITTKGCQEICLYLVIKISFRVYLQVIWIRATAVLHFGDGGEYGKD
jgi:hypothetical protein